MKEQIEIVDFDLFVTSLQALGKIINSAKFIINQTGLTIYSQAGYARSEFFTTAIKTKNEIDFCFDDISMLNKIFTTVKNIHNSDYSELEFFYEKPAIKIESTKFKTKLQTIIEKDISGSISEKLKTVLTPVCEFTTNSQIIKSVNNHSFIYHDVQSLRFYLNTDSTMQNNVLYATIGNKTNNMNNLLTLKFADINFGNISRELIIDSNRLNLFNIVQSDNIKIELTDKNVLRYKLRLDGKDDAYTTCNIYVSLLAA